MARHLLLRTSAFLAVLTGISMLGRAESFYVAKGNAVYVIQARQLQLGDSSIVPLALIQRHWGWVLSIFHADSRKVEDIEFPDVRKMVSQPDLQPQAVIISERKFFEKVGPLQFFKRYPTDDYDGALDVTAVSRNRRIFVTLAPYQTHQFEGSTCIVTDVTTKKDLHVIPRISEVYTSMEPLLTWVSDRTVLAFEYAYHGNGGFFIDTKTDTRTPAWDATPGAQFFSFDGSKLTLYVPNGDHFDLKVSTNFANTRGNSAGFMLVSKGASSHGDTVAFQPLN